MLSQVAVRAVVAIQHCQAVPRRILGAGPFQALEQPGFRSTVVLERAVFVEMLVGDIGDRANVKLAGIGAMLCPSVGSRFKDGVSRARRHHLGHVFLQVLGIGRGHVEARVQNLLTDYCVHA